MINNVSLVICNSIPEHTQDSLKFHKYFNCKKYSKKEKIEHDNNVHTKTKLCKVYKKKAYTSEVL